MSCSSLGAAEVSINDLFDKSGRVHKFNMPLTQAVRDANNRGTIKFSAGYFPCATLESGTAKAASGTTIKMKVGGPGAPLVDNEASQKRAGNCRDLTKPTENASDTYVVAYTDAAQIEETVGCLRLWPVPSLIWFP